MKSDRDFVALNTFPRIKNTTTFLKVTASPLPNPRRKFKATNENIGFKCLYGSVPVDRKVTRLKYPLEQNCRWILFNDQLSKRMTI